MIGSSLSLRPPLGEALRTGICGADGGRDGGGCATTFRAVPLPGGGAGEVPGRSRCGGAVSGLRAEGATVLPSGLPAGFLLLALPRAAPTGLDDFPRALVFAVAGAARRDDTGEGPLRGLALARPGTVGFELLFFASVIFMSPVFDAAELLSFVLTGGATVLSSNLPIP